MLFPFLHLKKCNKCCTIPFTETVRTDSIIGASVGGTASGILVLILIILLIIALIYIGRSQPRQSSTKHKLEHVISLPYSVEEQGNNTATIRSSRGPQILVLNAPTPTGEDRTNFEIYNSLFDEEGIVLSNYNNDYEQQFDESV